MHGMGSVAGMQDSLAGPGTQRFWTSDLHLNHRNIIRYCNRPWADVQEMNDALVQRWNDTVPPEATVMVLGDVAMGHVEDGLALVHRLNGRKVLVAGNHDRFWRGAQDKHAARWRERYTDAGFEIASDGEPLHTTVGGHPVVVSHFPYRGDSHDHDRYVEHRPVDHGEWVVHGHVHDAWTVQDRQVNVGVDVWDYRPVSERQLTAVLDAGSQAAQLFAL